MAAQKARQYPSHWRKGKNDLETIGKFWPWVFTIAVVLLLFNSCQTFMDTTLEVEKPCYSYMGEGSSRFLKKELFENCRDHPEGGMYCTHPNVNNGKESWFIKQTCLVVL